MQGKDKRLYSRSSFPLGEKYYKNNFPKDWMGFKKLVNLLRIREKRYIKLWINGEEFSSKDRFNEINDFKEIIDALIKMEMNAELKSYFITNYLEYSWFTSLWVECLKILPIFGIHFELKVEHEPGIVHDFRFLYERCFLNYYYLKVKNKFKELKNFEKTIRSAIRFYLSSKGFDIEKAGLYDMYRRNSLAKEIFGDLYPGLKENKNKRRSNNNVS